MWFRTEISASSARPEIDAAKTAEVLAWLVQGVDVEVSFYVWRVLSVRWVLSVKHPSLIGLLPRLNALLCARRNEERDKALSDRVLQRCRRLRCSSCCPCRHHWLGAADGGNIHLFPAGNAN